MADPRLLQCACLYLYEIPLIMTLPMNFMHYKLLAETMHDVSSDLVPSNLKDLFVPTVKIHSYNTLASVSKNFYIQKSNTTFQELVQNCGMRYQLR